MEWNAEDSDTGFNNTIRECVIFFLLFIVLQFLSYALISMFRKRHSVYPSDHDDVIVYQVSLWTCVFSLSISIGAALLLPISIMSNEIRLLYPDSYYILWLNMSLIQGLWNLAFLFSNVAIFILLPFAHFFSESQGFSNSHRGIRGRICETFCVLILVALLFASLIYIICAIFDYKKDAFVSIFKYAYSSDTWQSNFPFLYSCVSFLGVLLLLVCTPVGFVHLFTVVGKLFINESELNCLQSDYAMLNLERTNILVKLDGMEMDSLTRNHSRGNLKKDLQEITKTIKEMESVLKGTRFRRNFCYPFSMGCLLTLTSLSVMMVAQNILALCLGLRSLPTDTKNFSLGKTSSSSLGAFGALLEILLVLYLWCSSVVGLYALPFFRRLRPKLYDTPMIHMTGNCVMLLILSSALPVLARSIGITNFDLLGDFGRIHWLGNIYIVLFYNIVFAVSTVLCLGTKITTTVRQELVSILRSFTRVSSHPKD